MSPRQFLAGLLAAACMLSLPASLFALGQQRADQARTLCLHDERQWDALHAVIKTAAAPAGPSSLDKLTIPADTPASVIEILRQLTVAEQSSSSTAALYRAQGSRPVCK